MPLHIPSLKVPRGKAVEQLSLFTVGILSGMGFKYLWEIFRLPGYGQRITRLSAGGGTISGLKTHEQWLAVDDLFVAGIGVVLMIAGIRKHYNVTLFGLGWILGVALVKVIEVFQVATPQGTITPLDRA